MTMVIQKPITSAKFSNTDAFAKIKQKKLIKRNLIKVSNGKTTGRKQI